MLSEGSAGKKTQPGEMEIPRRPVQDCVKAKVNTIVNSTISVYASLIWIVQRCRKVQLVRRHNCTKLRVQRIRC